MKQLLTLVLIGLTSLYAQTVPSNVPTNGLVGWWPFNGNANDVSGNNFILTNSFVQFNNDNERGAVAYFNGNAWLQSDTSIFQTQSPKTISFWAKTSMSYAMDIVSQACGTDCGDDIRVQLNAAQCGYTGLSFKSPAHFATAPGIVSDSTWHHFTLVLGSNNNFSYGNFQFYIDGIFVAIGPTQCGHNWGGWTYTPNANYSMKIGKGGALGSNFKGKLDDIGIWNRALTQQEILSLFTSNMSNTACSDLFFSEYIEGSSNNKALEIYNPTNAAINLSNYSVKAYNNGGTAVSNSFILPNKTLAAHDVFVIANPNAVTAILSVADTTSTITFFNGDDAVVLYKGTDTLDIIGKVGVDPGTNWTVGTGATSEFTLVRKAPVNKGQRNWVIGANEWDVYPQNTATNLGSHSSNCAGSFVQTVPSHIPAAGLVGWWPFNGNSNDMSGNNFTLTNAYVQFTADVERGNVAEFNGNSWLESDTSIIQTQSPMTISFWAKTEKSYAMDIVSQACGNDCGDDIRVQLNAAQCGYTGLSFKSPAHFATAPGNVSDSSWHHYTLVMGSNNNFSYNNFRFYIDGAIVVIGPTQCSHNWGGWTYNPNGNYSFTIGKGGPLGYYYKGKLDEIAIWNRALSHQEILSIHDSTVCISDVPTITTETACGPESVTMNATWANTTSQQHIWLSPAGVIRGRGNTFTTPVLTASATQNSRLIGRDNSVNAVSGGPQITLTNPTGGGGNFSNGMWFTATQPFMLDSVTVRAIATANGGVVKFLVRISEKAGTHAASTGAQLYLSDTITVSTTLTTGELFRVPVNIPVLPGSYYVNINFVAGTTGQLFRSTALPTGTTYPYALGGLGSLDSVQYGTVASGNNRVYYLFNWKMSAACLGPIVTTNVPFLPLPSNSLPHSTNFATGAPCNWVATAASGATWQGKTGYTGNGYTATSLNGTPFVMVDDYAAGSSASTPNSVLTTPSFPALGYDTLTLKFKSVFKGGTWGGKGYVEVWRPVNGVFGWQTIDSLSADEGIGATATGWAPATKSYNVTAYQSNQFKARFRYDDKGNWAGWWAMDNFQLYGTLSPTGNVRVAVTTDIYGSEVSWKIVNTSNKLVYASKGQFNDVTPYVAATATHIDTVALPLVGQYEFRITDAYGDGLYDGTNTGTYLAQVLCPNSFKIIDQGSGALPNDPGGSSANVPSWDSAVFDMGCSSIAPPTTIPSITYCQGAVAAQLTATALPSAILKWFDGQFNPLTQAPIPSTLVSGATTYYVGQLTLNGLSALIPIVVTINPLPVVNAGTDVTVCAGTPVTLSGSGASTYTWNNAVSNAVAFTPTATTTYTVTVTNANGCVNTDQVVVTVNPLPVINAGSDIGICAGQPILLSGSSLTSHNNNLVAWWGFNGNLTDLSGFANHGASSTVSLTTDRFNNLNSAYSFNGITSQVNVGAVQNGNFASNSNFTYSFWVRPDGIKFGRILSYFSSVPGDLTFQHQITYEPNGSISFNCARNIGQANAPYAQATVSNVTANQWHHVLASYNNGLLKLVVDSSFISTANYTGPISNTGLSSVLNFGFLPLEPTERFGGKMDEIGIWNRTLTTAESNSLFNGSAFGIGTQPVFTWNNSVSNGVAFTPTATTTYTVTGTNANGCVNTDQVVVTVNPLPVVSAGADLTVCAGTPVTLSGSGASTYTWNNAVSNAVAFTPTATTTYTVTGTDANGCVNVDSVRVTVNALPVVVAGSDRTVCAGELVTLIASNNLPSYIPIQGLKVWYPLDTLGIGSPSSNGNINVGRDLSGNNHNWHSSGSYIPRKNRFGVSGGAMSYSDDVLQTPFPGILGKKSRSISLWVKSKAAQSSPIMFSYGSETAGNRLSGHLNFQCTGVGVGTAFSTITNTTTLDTNWHHLVYVFDSTQCATSSCNVSDVDIYVDGLQINSCNAFNPTIALNTLSTYNLRFLFGAQSIANANRISYDDFGMWERALTPSEISNLYLGGTPSSSSTTYTWNNGVSNAVAFTPTATTTYTVTGTDANGCVNTDQVVVTVNPLPVVNAGTDVTVCAGTPVTLSGSGASTYTWNNAVGNAVAFTPTATATYTVTGTNTNGCVNTDQVVVTVNPLPVVNAGTDVTVCAGTSVTLSGSGASTYTWNNAVSNAVAFTPTATTTYTVTGTNANGCVNMDSLVVTVNAMPDTTVTITGSLAFCPGGSVTLTAASGLGYLWSTGNTGQNLVLSQSATVFAVVATVNGCIDTTASFTTTLFAGADTSVTASSLIFCASDSATITAAGGQSYAWNTGDTTQSITVNLTGNYAATVTTVNGCVGVTDTVSTTVVPDVVLPQILGDLYGWFASGDTVNFSVVNTGGYSLNWGITGGVITGGQGGDTISVVWGAAGSTAAIWVVVSNGVCQDSAYLNLVISGLGTGEDIGSKAMAYPNPNSGVFTLEWSALEATRVSIYNGLGQVVASQQIAQGSTSTVIDLSAKAAGIYRAVIYGIEGTVTLPVYVRH